MNTRTHKKVKKNHTTNYSNPKGNGGRNRSQLVFQDVSYPASVNHETFTWFLIDSYYKKSEKFRDVDEEHLYSFINNIVCGGNLQGNEYKCSVPVIIVKDVERTGYKRCKIKGLKEKIYCKPIPQFDNSYLNPRQQGVVSEDVFEQGDNLISLLMQNLPEETMAQWKDLRKNEKLRYHEVTKKYHEAYRNEREIGVQYQTQKNELDGLKQDLHAATNSLTEKEQDIQKLKSTINEKIQEIKQIQQDNKDYAEKVLFFRDAQEFAKKAEKFFETFEFLQISSSNMSNLQVSDDSVDDYNYYLLRIQRKFQKSTCDLSKVDIIRQEIGLLSKTSMALVGGYIDSKLHELSANEQQGTLQMVLYIEIFRNLAGAAIVMSDELAYLLPRVVSGIDNKVIKQFKDISMQLQQCVVDMGYSIHYARPYAMITDCPDVKNVRFTEAEIPTGTIFEVVKLAVNFGTMKEYTEVSAKE